MKLWSGMSGRRKGSVSRSMSALRQHPSDEVIGGHGAEQAQLDPPVPFSRQVLDRLDHFALPVGLHEEGGMNGVHLMGWLPNDAGDAVPLHRVSQGICVLVALRSYRSVNDLSEFDPGVPGGVGVRITKLVRQPRRLPVLRDRKSVV